MEKIRIDILGQEYTVVSDESPKYVQSLANRLATHISGILKGGANVPQNAAMALVAISYLDELEKNAAAIEKLNAKIIANQNEIEKLKAEIESKNSAPEENRNNNSPSSFDGAQLKLL